MSIASLNQEGVGIFSNSNSFWSGFSSNGHGHLKKCGNQQRRKTFMEKRYSAQEKIVAIENFDRFNTLNRRRSVIGVSSRCHNILS